MRRVRISQIQLEPRGFDVNSRLSLAPVLLCIAQLLTAAEDPVVAPPKDQDPTVAERGYFEKVPRAWNDFHKLFLERAKQGPVDMLFLGDSILQGWGDVAQKDLWKTHFESYKAANFSIGGDRTQQVLWRIANGELDGMTPKLVVVHIGGNNLWSNDAPEKVAEGTKKIVDAIHAKLPKANVLIVGLLPALKSSSEPMRDRIRQVNALTAKFDDGKAVRFLDVGAKFVDAGGNIDAEKDFYQPDFVHLKTKGYETWAAAVKPLIVEMLK